MPHPCRTLSHTHHIASHHINANILAIVHFKGTELKKAFTNYKQAEGERQREGEGAECGRDTSRKLYLHHLHMKLVCTTVTAAGQVESQAGAGWRWGQLGAAIGIWLAYRGCLPR